MRLVCLDSVPTLVSGIRSIINELGYDSGSQLPGGL